MQFGSHTISVACAYGATLNEMKEYEDATKKENVANKIIAQVAQVALALQQVELYKISMPAKNINVFANNLIAIVALHALAGSETIQSYPRLHRMVVMLTDNVGNLSQIAAVITNIALFALGAEVYAIVSLTLLAYGALERRNIIPSSLKKITAYVNPFLIGIGAIHSNDPILALIFSVKILSQYMIKNKGPAIKTPEIKTAITEPKPLEDYGLIGMSEEIKEAVDTIIYSRNPSLSSKIPGMPDPEPIKGALLYGPAGTGKTTIAKNMATMLGVKQENFHCTSGSKLLGSLEGESEKNLRALFKRSTEDEAKYGDKSPLHCIVIDEIDSILPKRTNAHLMHHKITLVNQFLSLMDGTDTPKNFILIGMTNNLDKLDEVAIRACRIDIELEVSLPNEENRKAIFAHYLKPYSAFLKEDISIEQLAKKSNQYSPAAIKGLVNTAVRAYQARYRKHQANATKIGMSDFKIEAVKKGVSKEELKKLLEKIPEKKE